VDGVPRLSVRPRVRSAAFDTGESSDPPVPQSGGSDTDAAVVAAQVGRAPRAPWRVAARCAWGYPTAVASPSRLSDGTPFPTFAWLTCPWLYQRASAAESRSETAEWCRRAAVDDELRSRLVAADRVLRERRTVESGGRDECESVGIAGQRDPLAVKCLHAHLALAVVGIDDPIGLDLLGEGDRACPDRRCARLAKEASSHNSDSRAKEDA